jgi:hypothetical protein
MNQLALKILTDGLIPPGTSALCESAQGIGKMSKRDLCLELQIQWQGEAWIVSTMYGRRENRQRGPTAAIAGLAGLQQRKS